MSARLCDFCGGSFVIPTTHPNQRYCSLSHAAQGRRRLPWTLCGWCRERYPQRKSRQMYCSIACGLYGRHARAGAA